MKHLLLLIVLLGINACKPAKTDLPYLGRMQVDEQGNEVKHTVRDWEFLNQDSVVITNATYAGEPYIADFFFTSCPSICPKVTKQMLRIYERFKDRDIQLVSFTIDPKRDDVDKLKLYANNLEVDHDKWHFLTGDKEFTLDLADDYFVAAYEDPDAPGGFDHSGKIILVDGDGHVRAFAEGTDADDVTDFFEDVELLLAIYEGKK